MSVREYYCEDLFAFFCIFGYCSAWTKYLIVRMRTNNHYVVRVWLNHYHRIVSEVFKFNQMTMPSSKPHVAILIYYKCACHFTMPRAAISVAIKVIGS